MKQNENTKYVKLGITGAAVLAFGFAIMYILNQSKNIAAGIQLVFNILKPFLYGALIAYLLAPICNRMDERFLKWFPKATEKQKKGLKFLSIAIAVICAVTIVVLLILLILLIYHQIPFPSSSQVSPDQDLYLQSIQVLSILLTSTHEELSEIQSQHYRQIQPI